MPLGLASPLSSAVSLSGAGSTTVGAGGDGQHFVASQAELPCAMIKALLCALCISHEAECEMMLLLASFFGSSSLSSCVQRRVSSDDGSLKPKLRFFALDGDGDDDTEKNDGSPSAAFSTTIATAGTMTQPLLTLETTKVTVEQVTIQLHHSKKLCECIEKQYRELLYHLANSSSSKW
jgi:hypothetical protein